MNTTARPISELVDALSEVEAYFRSHDSWVRSSQHRLAHYRTAIARATRALGARPLTDAEREDLYVAILECDELLSIARSKAEVGDSKRARGRLRRVLKGAPNHGDSRDDRSRQEAFNLATAAFVASDPRFKSVLIEHPADVSAFDGETHLYIECKRPASEASFAEALEQCYEWFSPLRGAPDRHAAAIDCTRALFPRPAVLSFANEEDAQAAAHAAMQNLASRTIPRIRDRIIQRFDIRSVSVVFLRTRFVCAFRTDDSTVEAVAFTVWGIAQTHQLSDDDAAYFKAFARQQG